MFATPHAADTPRGVHPCRGRRPRMSPDDACLRARFHSRDEAPLAEGYRRYHARLLSIGVRRLGDRELAAEAAQQAFVQAWRAAGSYDPSRALAPWLYSIMRRVCVDLFRRDRRAPELFPDGMVPDHGTV